MLKLFSNIFAKNTRFTHKNSYPRYNFARKTIKETEVQLPEPADSIKTEDYEEGGHKLDYIKVYHGLYPYMPLDDHPLIPGYARMIAVTREITEKLKELNAEKTKIVISVLRNPEKVEALQASMYIYVFYAI
jgi:hypothetical protein